MITNYVGELIQHDTSIHLWAPVSGVKWYLITTIDDYSRKLLYADLWEKESSWAHITAAKSVVTGFGCPLKYYVDNHSIFRFNERDATIHRQALITEDQATVQWKEVLEDLRVEIICALSPAAKGKIERPYRWLQDHLVRICAGEGATKIDEARQILHEELRQYNHHRLHSTTKEIPGIRFERMMNEKWPLFTQFAIRPPYLTTDDIFCLRWKRTVNAYRKVSIHNLDWREIPSVQKEQFKNFTKKLRKSERFL